MDTNQENAVQFVACAVHEPWTITSFSILNELIQFMKFVS